MASNQPFTFNGGGNVPLPGPGTLYNPNAFALTVDGATVASLGTATIGTNKTSVVVDGPSGTTFTVNLSYAESPAYTGGTTKTVPAGLGWNLLDANGSPVMLSPSVEDAGANVPAYGRSGIGHAALFDRFSTARSAPAATYYLNAGGAGTYGGVVFGAGNDANDGLSAANPKQSINSAVTAINAANPATVKIFHAGGVVIRDYAVMPVLPTMDSCWSFLTPTWIGSFNTTLTWTVDGTNPSVYTATRANVDRVADLTRADKWGNPVEFTFVSTLAKCRLTPNSWTNDGGNVSVWVNRADGNSPTTGTTRVYLSGINVFGFNYGSTAPRSVLIEGLNGSPVSIEGGSGVILNSTAASQPNRRAFVLANVRCLFAGGVAQGYAPFAAGGAGVNGLVAAYQCGFYGAGTDGFNLHNSVGVTNGFTLYGLTVNCQGCDNGKAGQTSCNGLTTHENVVHVDVAGDYRDNRGGSCRHIGTTKTLFVGTLSSDLGDMTIGGTIPPTAYYFDDTSQAWMDGCKADVPPGGRAIFGSSSGVAIYERAAWPTKGGKYSLGAISTY